MQQQLDTWIRALIRWAGYVPNRDLSGWVLLTIAILLGFAVDFVVTQIIRFVARRRPFQTLTFLKIYVRWAFYVFVPSLFFLLATNIQSTRFLRRHPVADKVAEVLFLITATWLVVQLLKVGELLLIRQYDTALDVNLSHRKFVTQVRFFRRVLVAGIIVVSASLLLISFQGSRKVGLSVLTSAGVVSVLIGFAAQKTLANLMAGIQIAFNQQIRLDDAVVVEKEWGRIEEINLTSVIVRLWDRRRLILPITYFVETPFENWTRSDASIIGSIFLYLDYSVPIETLRKKARELAENDPLWTGESFAVQVTDTQPTCIVVRVLVSAIDAPSAFDLRCHMRENLIAFLRDEYPQSLPQTRLLLAEEMKPNERHGTQQLDVVQRKV
ncbi:mechanosensitive ion channel family protein [Spirosoma utsteinense]|uniref:Small-conductance mechanosensitive channel n=1 Tax=Spirosoma utsteinense TaxID=2585773 RepID=A0ABR6W109_9BACT|nr:mechanosensitive ion channel domain-containing protein [Spirosoma utsteinense]MBC3785094.1 small-conductance mechanosensitive channel [Spirosoma utsteinense]MBC3790296.1 small-conductance mechanosensitive channel [Spirosoma utsteinense]